MTVNHWTWVLAGCCALAVSGCSSDETVESKADKSSDDPNEDSGAGGRPAEGTARGGSAAGGPDAGENPAGGAPPGGQSNLSSFENALVSDYCDDDTPCAPGLDCLQDGDVFFAEGTVPGGFCTTKCDDWDDPNGSTCSALDSRSLCLLFNNGTLDDETDDQGYCVDACFIGTNIVEGVPDCDARLDRGCYPLSADGTDNLGACLPRCFGDASCPGGFCDGATGACVKERAPGKGRGEVCTADDECMGGICYPAGTPDMSGVCTELCTIATAPGACGELPDSDEPPQSLCFPHIAALLGGDPIAELDLGICTGTCDEDGDCGHDGFICRLLPDEDATALGKKGVCLQSLAFEDPAAGGAGGAGGSGGAGGAGGDTPQGGGGAGGAAGGSGGAGGAGGNSQGGDGDAGGAGDAQGGSSSGGGTNAQGGAGAGGAAN